jgi:membrane protease subunit (stomatin/prohibitin family)
MAFALIGMLGFMGIRYYRRNQAAAKAGTLPTAAGLQQSQQMIPQAEPVSLCANCGAATTGTAFCMECGAPQ